MSGQTDETQKSTRQHAKRRKRKVGDAVSPVRMRRPDRELREVLERATRLSEADLLDLYERIVAELEGVPLGESRRDRRLRERVDALRALGSVRDELGLTNDDRLTARAFNEAAPSRVAGWNASRVVRAWGTWRNAADVFAGAKPPRRAEREAVNLVQGFRRSANRTPLDGLLEWLATKPTAKGMRAYTAWAHKRNEQLGPEEQRYLTASGVMSAMDMSFAPARRQAAAILADEEPPPVPEKAAPVARKQKAALPATYEVNGRQLVTLAGFASRLGLTKEELLGGARRASLSPPVLRHAGRSFWLADDCVRWSKGETVERRDGELNETVLDQGRLAQRLGAKPDTVWSRYLHSPHLLPPVAGKIGEQPWWDAAEVERWQAEGGGSRQHRYAGSPTVEIEGRTLLTKPAVYELLKTSKSTFERRQQKRPLAPALVFNGVNLWLREDLEAWDAGEEVERTEGELNGLVLGIPQIAARLDVDESSARKGLARGSDRYPKPDGAVGDKPFWNATSFEQWLAERQPAE